MTAAIEVDRVSFSYGEKFALDGVSLTVAQGTSCALVGPNGGGKSTLFRLITTLAHAQNGTIRIFGKDARTASSAIRKRLGVVFQNPALDGKLTVQENLDCQATLYSIPKSERKERTQKWLGLVGLLDRRADHVETLSGGLKRRLEIARACLIEPDLLLMDEPTSSLDPGARREIWKLIDELRNKHNLTLFFTTHLIEEAQASDYVIFMDGGKIIVEGRPEDLRNQLGGDILSISIDRPESLLAYLKDLGLFPQLVDGEIHLETKNAQVLIPQILSLHNEHVKNLSLGKPTLADLFLKKTGRHYEELS